MRKNVGKKISGKVVRPCGAHSSPMMGTTVSYTRIITEEDATNKKYKCVRVCEQCNRPSPLQ